MTGVGPWLGKQSPKENLVTSGTQHGCWVGEWGWRGSGGAADDVRTCPPSVGLTESTAPGPVPLPVAVCGPCMAKPILDGT